MLLPRQASGGPRMDSVSDTTTPSFPGNGGRTPRLRTGVRIRSASTAVRGRVAHSTFRDTLSPG